MLAGGTRVPPAPAIAPVLGVTRQRISQIRQQVEQGASDLHPAIDPETGEVGPDYPEPTPTP